MDFERSAKAQDYYQRLTDFMVESVFPAEHSYDQYRLEAGPNDHTVPPVVEELKKLAKDRGLWNLFLPAESGLTNLEYAPLAELSAGSRERLAATLAAWLDEQGRLGPAALRLGIHPQTARYRLARLRELFGDALDDPDTRFWLALALRVSGEAR